MKQDMNEIKLQLKYAGQHTYPPVPKYSVANSVGYS